MEPGPWSERDRTAGVVTRLAGAERGAAFSQGSILGGTMGSGRRTCASTRA